MQVLIIDDDPVTRRFLSLQVSMLAGKPQAAPGGREALELLSSNSFDLILLDCQMPDMDGYQTAAALRQAGYKGPLVGLSAEDGEAIRSRCLQSGMDEHRPKPVDVVILKQIVDKHVHATPPVTPEPIRPPAETRDPLARVRFMAEKSGFPALAKRLVDSFVKATDEVMASLNQAQTGQDQATILSCLHRLKGSAGFFGAEDFGDQVAALEERLERQGLADSIPAIDELGEAWKALRLTLQGI